MTVAGLGCRAGVGLDEVFAALDAALAAHALSRSTLRALATVPQRQSERALGEAAEALGLPLLVPESWSLARAETLSDSAASRTATGTGSAAEAAALAAAGTNARLLGPRLVTGPVTCAIAVGAS